MKNENFFSIKPIKKTALGEKYRIRMEVPVENGYIKDTYFVVEKGKERISYKLNFIDIVNGNAVFESDVELETRAIYRYYFFYTANDKPCHIKRESIIEDDKIISEEMYKMSVNFDTPNWAKGKMMYHIFVDRFKRGSNKEMPEMENRRIHKRWSADEMVVGPDEDGNWNIDFYGGDLKGITQSLDYIKSLGVSIIYLSPICYSQSTHRYDTSNYLEIDPYAGSKEDLKELCDEAHKRGMKVILDAVFNHTGNDSIYFDEYKRHGDNGAFQNLDSPYANFYKYKINDDKISYYYWFGMTNMPVCNGEAKEWQDFITGEGGVIDEWFSLGIDGLRLDVADELTDEFIEKIRIAVKRNKEDGFILGEVWDDPMNVGRGYIENGKCMDSVMNYQLVDGLIRYFKFQDVDTITDVIRRINTYYPDATMHTLMNFTSTHDISRPMTIFGSDYFTPYKKWAWDPTNTNYELCKKLKLTTEQYEHGKEIYKAFVFALAFMPGIFSIFYGDEIGMEGLGNLANRKPFTHEGADLELLEYFKGIGKVRSEEESLVEAKVKLLYINKDYFMYERSTDKEKILFAISNSNEERTIVIPDEYKKHNKVYSLKDSSSITLKPHGGIAIKAA